MKKLLLIWLAFLVSTLTASTADVTVKEHRKKDGTVVREHKRTEPNKKRNDNYSTKGNINPYTGKAGTKPRDGESGSVKKRSVPQPTYSEPVKRSKAELKRVIQYNEQIVDRFVRQSSPPFLSS